MRSLWVLLVGALAWSVCEAWALGAPPLIPGELRARRAGMPETEVGALLISELQCGACHELPAELEKGFSPRRAPILDSVGSRLQQEYVEEFVQAPHVVEPGTRMPNIFHGMSPREAGAAAKAITAALCGDERPAQAAPARQRIQLGRKLFHEIGCVACHGPQEAAATAFPARVPFPDLGKKYSIPSLASFLQDPFAVRPSGRMPHLNVNPQESLAIASYLLRGIKVEAAIRFRYYEGSWQELPDFDSLQPKSSGVASDFDLALRERGDEFGFSFESYLHVPRPGAFTFHLGSDDGSQLWVDGEPVAKPDGVHPLSWQSGKLRLDAGVYPIRVDYFEFHGGEELRVEWEGPGIRRGPLVSHLVVSPDRAKPIERTDADPELVRTGRQLLQQSRCAACHQINGIPAPPKTPISLNHLQDGCLSMSADAALPDFELSGPQRRAILAALKAARDEPAAALPPSVRVRRTMLAMNCFACHERDGMGGVDASRQEWFAGDQPEMGDEGRIPPSLTGAGLKLRPSWLDEIWERGTHERFYMKTRMPRFGKANVGELTETLAKADQRELTLLPYSDSIPDRRLKAGGRFLAGGQGFSCIKCHRFAKFPATGIQAISMTSMTKRLRPEWFHAYMLDPAKFRPGTRMPAAWPNGQVLLPKVLDGTAGTQIHAVWVFLTDGEKASPPQGLGRSPIELVATNHPVLYRNFIEGAGPRAIGVGYPERVNLAFDANRLRLALVWHNAFIDASLHWTGRGQGFQRPLGDNVLSLPTEVSVAKLAEAATPWPRESARDLPGYEFRGYRLDDDGRPVFLYEACGCRVEEHYMPISNKEFAPLERKLVFRSATPQPDVWFLAATGRSIELQPDGSYFIDSSWKTRIDSARTPVIRASGDRQELLVPIENATRSVIRQRLEW